VSAYLQIGTPVLYTHRACGVVWCPAVREPVALTAIGAGSGDDLFADPFPVIDEAHWVWSKRDARFAPTYSPEGHEPPRPSRRYTINGGTRPLDRWVYTWPESGEGYVVGLTFRSEGFKDKSSYYSGYGEPPEYEQPYLSESARFPLYEVRRTLRSRSVLCPTWSVVAA
jgi:hypothetical protein